MKPINKKTTVLTGLFVIAAIAILLATILFIGGKDNVFTKSISATAVFDDVSGLTAGNSVWFEGVKIGTVKGIDFAGNGVYVSFIIEEKAVPHIYADTKAKLGSDGLIGNKIIVLYGGSAPGPKITNGHIFE